MKKLKYFIPAFVLMIAIFLFSQQTGNESSGLSTQIVVWIQNNLHITIPEFLIRKGAHMSEYAVLTFTFIYGFSHLDLSNKQFYLLSFLSPFLYACTDEFHQLFINGRAGQWMDVMIDSGGIFIALLIFYIYQTLKKKTLSH